MVTVPRLSILVPLSGATKLFENTLASVLQNRPSRCQVLVTHAGPYNDPWDLAAEVDFIELPEQATVVDLLNAGLEEVQGDVVHVLQDGVEATEGWTEAVLPHFADPEVASVSPLIVDSKDRQRIVTRGVSYGCGGARRLAAAGKPASSRVPRTPPLGPTLHAGFYRTDALVDIGGFEPTVGGALADVDAALTLKSLGFRCVHEARSCLVGELVPASAGSFATGRCAERLFWRHAPQVGKVRSMLVHPVTTLLSALVDLPHPGAVTQLFGRLAALRERSQFREFHEALREAKQQRRGGSEPAAESAGSEPYSSTPPSTRRAA